MSALRERLRAHIEAHVREVAGTLLLDLWGRERVSVLIERLDITGAHGRTGRTAELTTVAGTATADLIADFPEQLPDERLWARLARSHTLPSVSGYMLAPRVQMTAISESIGDRWAKQSLTFSIAGDFTGVE